MEISKKVFVCFFMAVGLHLSSACNGYKVRLVKMENCAGVVRIDMNVTLSINCELIMKGCGETSGFGTCTAKYTILKNGYRMISGTIDACAELQKDTRGIATALSSFDLPMQCPMERFRYCPDETQKINLSQFKYLLPLFVGKIDVSIDATHDTGKSCLHAVINVDR